MKKSLTIALGVAAVVLPFSVETDQKLHSVKITAIGYQARIYLVEKKLRLRIPGLLAQATVDLGGKKKPNGEMRPLFKDALALVSDRKKVSVGYLCRKLGVGNSCGEAFLETMQEMGVVAHEEDGKYNVIMDKSSILELQQ